MTWQHISEPTNRVMDRLMDQMQPMKTRKRAPAHLLPIPQSLSYDFSHCRQGAVVRFRLDRNVRLDQWTARAVVKAIGLAAERAGLNWEAKRDDARNELRISFR